MGKTELGYQALIYLNGQDSLNFCFKNGKGEWDNNEGKNYVFEIAPLPKDLIVVQESSLIGIWGRSYNPFFVSVKRMVISLPSFYHIFHPPFIEIT